MEKPKCPICQGTGFSKPGEICACITGNVLDIFSDILGGLFRATPGKKDTNEGQSDGQKGE